MEIKLKKTVGCTDSTVSTYKSKTLKASRMCLPTAQLILTSGGERERFEHQHFADSNALQFKIKLHLSWVHNNYNLIFALLVIHISFIFLLSIVEIDSFERELAIHLHAIVH